MPKDWKETAEFMLRYQPERLLESPSPVANLEHEARESLTYAAQRQPFDFDNVVFAVEDALSFLMETRKFPGVSVDLIIPCLKLKDRLDETIRELKKDDRAADLICKLELAKQDRAKRFSGIGTRGMKASAPRNRIVIRLFDYMRWLQEVWRLFVPAAHRKTFKKSLHPTASQIVCLPPLSRASALGYHQVGRLILRDANGKKDFSYHPAFGPRGEFHAMAKQNKSLDGALNTAWRELAKLVERAPERFEKL
ncbi:hypothetical protein LBMAG57_38340 [Verrucomicrobiota bacterium]|nr:hypothetical protein LBMAG57_38340 [Verrucomicrobiota bacterium]